MKSTPDFRGYKAKDYCVGVEKEGEDGMYVVALNSAGRRYWSKVECCSDTSSDCDVMSSEVNMCDIIKGIERRPIQVLSSLNKSKCNRSMECKPCVEFEEEEVKNCEVVHELKCDVDSGNCEIVHEIMCKPACEQKHEMMCETDCKPKHEMMCKPACEPMCKPSCEPKQEMMCETECKPKQEMMCKPMCEPKQEMMCKPMCETECKPMCEPKCESECKPMCESACEPKCEPVDNTIVIPGSVLHLEPYTYNSTGLSDNILNFINMVESKQGMRKKDQIGDWMLFTKCGCVHCENAKQLLVDNGQTISVIEEDKITMEQCRFLDNNSGQSEITYPRIFLNGKLIGGYNELSEYLNKESPMM